MKQLIKLSANRTARFMQQVEASRDFALAVLAHDLRNPLNAMKPSGECLTLPPKPDEATIKYARLCSSQATITKIF